MYSQLNYSKTHAFTIIGLCLHLTFSSCNLNKETEISAVNELDITEFFADSVSVDSQLTTISEKLRFPFDLRYFENKNDLEKSFFYQLSKNEFYKLKLSASKNGTRTLMITDKINLKGMLDFEIADYIVLNDSKLFFFKSNLGSSNKGVILDISNPDAPFLFKNIKIVNQNNEKLEVITYALLEAFLNDSFIIANIYDYDGQRIVTEELLKNYHKNHYKIGIFQFKDSMLQLVKTVNIENQLLTKDEFLYPQLGSAYNEKSGIIILSYEHSKLIKIIDIESGTESFRELEDPFYMERENFEFKMGNDIGVIMDYFDNNYIYTRLIYDKYHDRYYRISKVPAKETKPDDIYVNETSYLYLLTYDANFNFLGAIKTGMHLNRISVFYSQYGMFFNVLDLQKEQTLDQKYEIYNINF